MIDQLGLKSFCDALKELALIEQSMGTDNFIASIFREDIRTPNHTDTAGSIEGGSDSGSDKASFEGVDLTYVETWYAFGRLMDLDAQSNLHQPNKTSNMTKNVTSKLAEISLIPLTQLADLLDGRGSEHPDGFIENLAENYRGADIGIDASGHNSLLDYWGEKCDACNEK